MHYYNLISSFLNKKKKRYEFRKGILGILKTYHAELLLEDSPSSNIITTAKDGESFSSKYININESGLSF